MKAPVAMRRHVTIKVDDAVVSEQVVTTPDDASAAEFASQVWILGQERRSLIGKRITATIDWTAEP